MPSTRAGRPHSDEPPEGFSRPLMALATAGVLAVVGGYFALRPADSPEHRPAAAPDDDSAYREFVARLDGLPDPKNIHDERTLERLIDGLERLAPSPDHETAWARSDGLRRRGELTAEARALDDAVYQQKARFRKLTEDGTRVLRHKDEPDLPTRARAVIDRGKEPPAPRPDETMSLPRTGRLSYGQVFRFPGVEEAVAEWHAVREKLEPIARLAAP